MIDRTFSDIARECGYDMRDISDDIESCGADAEPADPRFGYHAVENNHFSDYADEIVSSPSPSQRYGSATSNRRYYAPESSTRYDANSGQYEERSYLYERAYESQSEYYPQDLYDSPHHSAMQGRNDVEAQYHHDPSPLAPRSQNAPYRRTYNDGAPRQRDGNPAPVSYGTRSDSFQSVPRKDAARGQAPRNTHGIRLRPVSELPDVYREIFKFGVFNAVQSSCFDTVVHSDDNMVISAPTGSGKTVLFELAIIRMLTQASSNGRDVKCVYMAPTKALCSERYQDWVNKFQGLGVKCCELTGDTVTFGRGAWGDAITAQLIITTSEKWDSLTRNWREHNQILSQIQLFLVDEVHILNETRGSTLEVVISRMKTRGTAVRFVMVSATVPNIEDVANWIGSGNYDGSPAQIFQFGEEFRPCKLTRIVCGIRRGKDQNDFAFAKTLDFRLFAILQQHATGKPVLVFGPTRNGCLATAKQLAKEYEQASRTSQTLPWQKPARVDHKFQDSKLNELASLGIGIHHAGINLDDRRATEDMFMKKTLKIIVATSTLAVGVNLPAHTVVIKGVKAYLNNASTEYSDLDIMQMMGRAGRPQFDKDGIAIILCETELEAKYRALVQGKTLLESNLHLNLPEHLNSEIGLGTITNIHSAKVWLRESFLFQRIQKNPRHYALGKNTTQTWQERVDDCVMESVKKLQKAQLVDFDGDETDGVLSSTEYGDIMSKFYIKQATMTQIMKLSEKASVREILEVISSAAEFADMKIRSGERSILNKLKQHQDIRFQIKKVEKVGDKVMLLIQAILGGISLNAPEYKSPDCQPQLEALGVFRHVVRISKAVAEVGIVKKSGAQTKHGLELARCLTAKAWEDRPVVLRQIEQIGEKSIKVLAENGIGSFDALRKQNPLRIETLLNRRSPFGFDVLAAVQELPQYSLAVQEDSVTTFRGKQPVEVQLNIECSLLLQDGTTTKLKKHKGRGQDWTSILTITSDLDFIDYRRIATKALKEHKSFQITAHLTKPSQSIAILISSESFAGVSLTQTYKPSVDRVEYPTLDTRPKTSAELDLEGLEDDPDFWNMAASDDEDTLSHKPQTQRTGNQKLVRSQHSQQANDPENADDMEAVPEKLPNGNYKCNHLCKDKTVCRHICCRDGLLEPPKASRKTSKGSADQVKGKASKLTDFEQKAQNTTQKPEKGVTAKVKSSKPLEQDPLPKQLEATHTKTDGKGSSRLPDDRRLKLPDKNAGDGRLSRKGRPVPNFDLQFSSSADGGDLGHHATVRLKDIDDDDELPDPSNLPMLSRADDAMDCQPSSTNYSDSEVDALIRAAPLDYVQDARSIMPVKTVKGARKYSSTAHYEELGSASGLADPPAKRRRYQDQTPERVMELSPCSSPERGGDPLFLPDEPQDYTFDPEEGRFLGTQDNGQAASGSNDEEFQLDYSLFDVVPASTQATPPSPPNYTATVLYDKVARGSDPGPPTQKAQKKEVQTTDTGVDFEPENDGPETAGAGHNIYMDYEDDLAELQAFLQSGAVEFVDKT